MPIKKLSASASALFALFAFIAFSSYPLFAEGKGKLLHSFSHSGNGGYTPIAGLVMDNTGNLYGTTRSANGTGCGKNGCGSVFELLPNGDGTWRERVVYRFCRLTGCADGDDPEAGLIFDAQGNLYGTTAAGGTGAGCKRGCGTVFELMPNNNGGWRETVLYSFSDNGTDAYGPLAGVVFDAKGNLYGTTPFGGNYGCQHMGCGAVFELSPSGGTWAETVIYRFESPNGGLYPYSGVIVDADGNLYGETDAGGAYSNQGTVYELAHQGDAWTENILHSFGKGKDGRGGASGLTFDAQGNLYGATVSGGAYGGGVVFQLKPAGRGQWNEQVLHSFDCKKDGCGFFNALILDASGNLYGATATEGTERGGTVFQLAANSWDERTLLNLSCSSEGCFPNGVIIDSSGHLYGTASQGGKYGYGTVFEVSP